MVEKDKKCCEETCLCPVEGIIDTVSKKWAICIISHFGENEEGYRFNELQRTLNGISPKSLSDRLKELGEEGLVNRNVEESAPPKVTYTLTADGKELHDRLKPLVEWVNERD
ncbi:MAG: winged helix-turn-helix transcriptional regulator [Candidatus Natronoplasma sp.]